ncbi:RDD family protein [uncultured Microbacterium sp.]|uniref:Predicted membrane protein/domain n=1 Tax=uncultured Microbacterium sp. TaxID=191216 RepID=A0A1Y5PE03_9MICO|nr:RDD family protein [uncultured Microbacterium sp.]SBS74371.1 Predicted membrane protein/domain [uncultured Microbacterium sp.]
MPTPGPTPVAPAQIRQDEILTGEAVALDVQPVGFFLRALGLLIDMVTGVALLVVFLLAAGWVAGVGLDLAALSPALTVASLAVVMVVVPTAVETATRGRSLGKLAVGSRIVRVDGGAAGFRHAFIRALTGVLEVWFTLGAVAGIVGAFTPRAQRLGDLLAGTYAERTRAPRLPAPVGGVPAPLADWARVADVTRLPYRVARRAAQFVRTASGLDPAARARTAAAIAADVAPYVSPVPSVDPETLVRAVVAVRRDREYAALVGEQTRVARLTAGVGAAPRGFPER